MTEYVHVIMPMFASTVRAHYIRLYCTICGTINFEMAFSLQLLTGSNLLSWNFSHCADTKILCNKSFFKDGIII